jgi:hypothetical protein
VFDNTAIRTGKATSDRTNESIFVEVCLAFEFLIFEKKSIWNIQIPNTKVTKKNIGMVTDTHKGI